MTGHTPVNFSLPSMLQGANDAPGLTTIRVLDVMVETHNEMVQALAWLAEPTAAAVDISATPVTHFHTPAAVLERQLLKYDRAKVLMPLLSAFSSHDDASARVRFDLHGIQAALANELLQGCTFVNLHCRQFTYLGELREAGRLSALAVHVPQEELPPAIKDAAMKELDSKERTTRVMAMLEDCINFLARLGGGRVGGVDGNMPLRDYVLDVLLLDAAVWNAAATPTISEHVKLAQLRALFLAIEGMTAGLEQRIDSRYREALPPELLHDLEAAAVWVDVTALLPILRDFLSDRLSGTFLAPTESLKVCLSIEDDALQDVDWFRHVPDGLQLRHTWAAFSAYKKWASN